MDLGEQRRVQQGRGPRQPAQTHVAGRLVLRMVLGLDRQKERQRRRIPVPPNVWRPKMHARAVRLRSRRCRGQRKLEPGLIRSMNSYRYLIRLRRQLGRNDRRTRIPRVLPHEARPQNARPQNARPQSVQAQNRRLQSVQAQNPRLRSRRLAGRNRQKVQQVPQNRAQAQRKRRVDALGRRPARAV